MVQTTNTAYARSPVPAQSNLYEFLWISRTPRANLQWNPPTFLVRTIPTNFQPTIVSTTIVQCLQRWKAYIPFRPKSIVIYMNVT